MYAYYGYVGVYTLSDLTFIILYVRAFDVRVELAETYASPIGKRYCNITDTL